MSGFLDILSSGEWLTQSRARLWTIAVLIASAGGIVYLLATSDGLIDYQGRPLGTDFSNVYTAGRMVLDGRAADAFDPRLEHAAEQAIFGEKTPFYGWHYPPFFLWLAAALALMPYQLALVVWQAATLGLYLWAVRSIVKIPSWPGSSPPKTGVNALMSRPSTTLPPDSTEDVDARDDIGRDGASRLLPGHDGAWWLLALAFPAVFVNLGHGHNGFLTAALIGFALIHLDVRPILAGILFGLLAYKPQFGLMIPLVLAATGRWRTIFAAAATILALVLAVSFAFGFDTWRAFFDSAGITRGVMEHGESGWHLIQSVFSA